ncbi:ABC transporter ATP-binding protein [Corynebacterium diphtheriae]|nr:ABC transporter ATP-binding protein [Corynebacterium diphtheriae]
MRTEPTPWHLIRWLLGITRPVLRPLGASTLCRIMNQVLGIFLYVIPAYALVAGVGSVSSVVAIMVVIALLKALLRYAEHYLGHLVAFKALELIRIRVFRDIYPQAPAIMRRTGPEAVGSGDMLTRLTRDIGQIEVFFAHTTAPVISAAVVPLGVVITISMLSPVHGLIAAAIFGVAVVVSLNNSAYRFAIRVSEHRGNITQHITDSVGGVAEVVGYDAQQRRQRELRDREEPLQTAVRRRGGIVGTRLGVVAAARICVLTMLLPTTDNMALAVACMFAVLRCWAMINEVADLGNHFSNSLAAARRVWSLAHAGLALNDGPQPLPTATTGATVEWDNVTFTYPAETTPALRNVCLTVPAGSWGAILGATGSGKSTLAALLLRYWDPTTGAIRVDGHDIRTCPLEQLRSTVSIVTQDITLLNTTVADNLRLAQPNATDAELIDALTVACLDRELTLDTAVGEQGANLSGGQRQRLSLAQALLRHGRVLILDEFTAHLNPALAANIRSRLREACPHTTIIEITHDLTYLDSYQWVAAIDSGSLIDAEQYSR